MENLADANRILACENFGGGMAFTVLQDNALRGNCR
jgi:hypothetical protein